MTQKEEALDTDTPIATQAPRWSIIRYIKEFFFEKYELTIFFPGEVHVQLDGTRIES